MHYPVKAILLDANGLNGQEHWIGGVLLGCVQTWYPSMVPENNSWWALMWTHLFVSTHARIWAWCPWLGLWTGHWYIEHPVSEHSTILCRCPGTSAWAPSVNTGLVAYTKRWSGVGSHHITSDHISQRFQNKLATTGVLPATWLYVAGYSGHNSLLKTNNLGVASYL